MNKRGRTPCAKKPMASSTEAGRPGIALLPLGIALVIMVGLSFYPLLVVGRNGHTDHPGLMLLCWAMSAGFTRGVGLVPKNMIARLLLSGWATLLALALGIARLAQVF